MKKSLKLSLLLVCILCFMQSISSLTIFADEPIPFALNDIFLPDYTSIIEGNLVLSIGDLKIKNIEVTVINEHKIKVKYNNCIATILTPATVSFDSNNIVIQFNNFEIPITCKLDMGPVYNQPFYITADILSIEMQPFFCNMKLLSSDKVLFLDKQIVIINQTHPLEFGFLPEKLEKIPSSIKAKLVKKDMLVNSDIIPNLLDMFEQAENAGVKSWSIVSAYRPIDYQQTLYNNKVAFYKKTMQTGYEDEAAKTVARPGFSEHQTGLAIDICANNFSIVKSFGETENGKWLANNSWKYGFILRYPAEKTDITGIFYEPWHFRYVGKQHAKYLYENNLALEEYYDNLEKDQFIVANYN